MKRLALALPLILLACAQPVTVVRAVDDRPRLLVEGAPAGAQLFIDGKGVGDAAAYAGNPGVLLVEPGTHVVEVKVGGNLVFSQKLFFGGGEQRKIAVGPGSGK